MDGSSPQDIEEFKRQQDIWAEELRKADARAQKFKEEVDGMLDIKRQMRTENVALQEKCLARDQEIQRLHHSYKGGQNFDGVKNDFD